MDYENLPRYIEDYTPEQVEKVIAFHAKLSMKELWRRMALNREQIMMGREQLSRMNEGDPARDRLERALRDIDHRQAVIMAAQDRKEAAAEKRKARKR